MKNNMAKFAKNLASRFVTHTLVVKLNLPFRLVLSVLGEPDLAYLKLKCFVFVTEDHSLWASYEAL